MCNGEQANSTVICYDVGMLRTKDLVLFLVAIIFLLVSVGATLSFRHAGFTSGTDMPEFDNAPQQEYAVELIEKSSLDRAEKLATMRQKIAEGQGQSYSAPVENSPDIDESSDAETSPSPDTITNAEDSDLAIAKKDHSKTQEILCSNYQRYVKNWPPIQGKVSVETVEGVRLVYQKLPANGSLFTSSATTPTDVATPTDTTQTILLQLPVRIFSDQATNCLPYDVVGIANDGSLIRNNETGMYGVFGADTVIGYALDGFPIYGISEIQNDACGGSVVNNQYRYHLSTQRDKIINCFSSPPASLP